jgi:hypothetical protein
LPNDFGKVFGFYMARSQTLEFYSYEKVISYIISAGTSSFWL